MLPALLVVLGICLCMATGCTSDSSDTTAPPTTDAAVSGAAKGSANAVPFATLISFLPDAPAGWTAEDPSGASLTVDGGQWTMASRGYAKGGATAVIIIQDSAYHDVGYWQSWNSFISFETSDGYYRQGRVNGRPSWECFAKPATYSTWVGVNERFVVYIAIEDGSKQDLDLFIGAVNYRGIAALK
jgi:hypothetical protein